MKKIFGSIFLLSAIAGVTLVNAVGPVLEFPDIEGIAIVRPENTSGFVLKLSNPGDDEMAGRLEISLQPLGAEVQAKADVQIDLGAGETVELPFFLGEAASLGVWTAAMRFSPANAKEKPYQQTLRFAIMEPMGPNATWPEFQLGVVAHHERERDPELRRREIVAAALVGSKVTRSNPTWGYIQPARGQWRWDLMDEFVDTFDELNMHIQVLLGYTPTWAAHPSRLADRSDGGRNITRSAPDAEAWREYVATFATRYKGRIPLWEPWNEPDIGFWRGTTEEFLQIAEIAIEEIRKADPDAKIMTPGFATLKPHAARMSKPDFQERVLRELGQRFDYHATHEHGGFSSFSRVVDDAYLPLRERIGDLPPLYFNETAIHSVGGPAMEVNQAWALIKKSTFARARGAVGYLWYDLRNDGTDPNYHEHNYGMVTRDFQPKPVYVAFNTLARYWVPRPYLKQLDVGVDRWFFVHGTDPQKAAGESRLLVFWNDDVATQNEQVLLSVPNAERVELIDVDGNRSELAVNDGVVVVNASAEPKYLLATGATDIGFSGLLATPTRAFFGFPGQVIDVACDFVNPTDHPIVVKTDWTAPLTMAVVGEPQSEIRLPANGRATASIRVKLPEGNAYRFGQSARLRLDYAFEGEPFSGNLLIPVRYSAISVSSLDADAQRAPDIVLNREDQIFSFIDADPNLVEYRWKGADMFSARAWIGLDANDLILRVEVTDNKHAQTQEPIAMWKGDSVQVVLAIPRTRGFWEFGFADHQQDGPMTAIWHRSPDGADPVLMLETEPYGADGEGRIYTARISRAELGLTDAALAEGIRMNIAINNADGDIRAHALQLMPGLVINKSVDNMPYILFEPLLPKPE